MKLLCDFHIHSALSPCADPEMTPGNIVGMAKLIGLQAIAITDHQSCGNCGAAIAISEKQGGPLVLPAMEAESSEEIHLICLFAELAAAQVFAAEIRESLPDIQNREDIFGEQVFFDPDDQPCGRDQRLLHQACRLDCETIARRALALGGVCLPAHIDREANGMLSVLGSMPPDFPATWLEISARANESELRARHLDLARHQLLRGSDAHRLADLALAGWLLDLPGFDPEQAGTIDRRDIIKALRAGLI